MVEPSEFVDVANAVFGKHPGKRALHAKGEFYEGTFTASSIAKTLTRAGHVQADSVPVLARLSNGTGNPAVRDSALDVRGFAISFKLPDGTSTDIVAQTAPRFPVRTPEAFTELVRASSQQWRMPLFLARHPTSAPALLENLRAGALNAPRSFATTTFYAIHAYRWIATDGTARWVRYTLAPQSTDGPAVDKSDRDYLFNELNGRLAKGPVRFSLRLHVAETGDDPHDPTSVWRSKERIDAGTIEILRKAPDPEADGKLVVFDPVRIVDGIELSDDPILRFRPLAYSESASRRAGN